MSARRITAIVGIAFMCVCEAALRFAHPALTETQLFLRFWPWHLLTFLACVTVLVLIRFGPDEA